MSRRVASLCLCTLGRVAGARRVALSLSAWPRHRVASRSPSRCLCTLGNAAAASVAASAQSSLSQWPVALCCLFTLCCVASRCLSALGSDASCCLCALGCDAAARRSLLSLRARQRHAAARRVSLSVRARQRRCRPRARPRCYLPSRLAVSARSAASLPPVALRFL